MRGIVIIILFFQVSIFNNFAQNSVLREKINKISQAKRATVGVGIMDFENGDTLTFNGKRH